MLRAIAFFVLFGVRRWSVWSVVHFVFVVGVGAGFGPFPFVPLGVRGVWGFWAVSVLRMMFAASVASGLSAFRSMAFENRCRTLAVTAQGCHT